MDEVTLNEWVATKEARLEEKCLDVVGWWLFLYPGEAREIARPQVMEVLAQAGAPGGKFTVTIRWVPTISPNGPFVSVQETEDIIPLLRRGVWRGKKVHGRYPVDDTYMLETVAPENITQPYPLDGRRTRNIDRPAPNVEVHLHLPKRKAEQVEKVLRERIGPYEPAITFQSVMLKAIDEWLAMPDPFDRECPPWVKGYTLWERKGKGGPNDPYKKRTIRIPRETHDRLMKEKKEGHWGPLTEMLRAILVRWLDSHARMHPRWYEDDPDREKFNYRPVKDRFAPHVPHYKPPPRPADPNPPEGLISYEEYYRRHTAKIAALKEARRLKNREYRLELERRRQEKQIQNEA